MDHLLSHGTGDLKLDVRDSTPDWTPYELAKAPQGAPNVLVILYDDTGFAAWSPYGGRIDMPTLQGLADNGLMYSQWHTTALCSPTRSTFLTGRNHHLNRFASIAEGTTGRGRLPGRLSCYRIGCFGQKLSTCFNASISAYVTLAHNGTIGAAMYPHEAVVDKNSRLILVVLFVGLAVFRLIRYVQIGIGKRRTSAIPSTSVAVASQSATAGDALIPSPQGAPPDGFAWRGLGLVSAVLSWIAGNALLWSALFGFRYLDSIPVFLRLFAGVFANLYLIRISRRIAERVTNIDGARSADSPFE